MSIITKGLIGQQDLSTGAGTFTRTTSTGGTNTLTKIASGALTAGKLYDILIVDGVQYATIAAAVAAAGTSNPVLIIIPSTYASTELPAIQNNLVFLDLRAGGRTGSGNSSFINQINSIQFNPKTAGLTDSMLRMELTRNGVDATGSILVGYFLTHLLNASVPVPGGTVDGIASEAQVDGTFSGTLSFLCGNEMAATLTSTGGNVTTAMGGIGYVFNTIGSTTVVTNAYGLWGRGCAGTISGTPPVNCYGLYGSEQLGIGSSRNYSLGIEGRGLLKYSGNQGAGGLDVEDHTGTPRHFVTVNAFDNVQIQEAVATAGLFLQDSTGANQLMITGTGAKFFKPIFNYNGINTVSNGVPAEYATVDLTAQTAGIAATTLYTPAATGMFRISAYLKITTAGTSPVLGPLTITYTDGTDSVAQSVVMSQQLQTGATSNTGNNGNTATSVLTGSLIIYAKTGVAIQYAVALTGTVGAAQYEVHLKCEAL